jgi:hypothetical protein
MSLLLLPLPPHAAHVTSVLPMRRSRARTSTSSRGADSRGAKWQHACNSTASCNIRKLEAMSCDPYAASLAPEAHDNS